MLVSRSVKEEMVKEFGELLVDVESVVLFDYIGFDVLCVIELWC